MQKMKITFNNVTVEWNALGKITGHSNSFFLVRPAKGAREKMAGAASDFAATEGGRARVFVSYGSVLTAGAKVKLVQGQFTLGIPSASPIRKSISWCVSTSSAA